MMIFAANWWKIAENNDNENKDVTMEINGFAHLSPLEFETYYLNRLMRESNQP